MSTAWDEFANPNDGIPRDGYGRALISPASGGPPIAHDRPSSYGGALDDQYGLGRWRTRMALVGGMLRRDLLNQVAACRDDNKALDKIAEQAIEAAAGSAGANTGTALHMLTEQLHAGADHTLIPEHLRADIAAYQACLERYAIEVVEVEQFVVCEILGCAGTLDRLMRVGDRLCIGDLKTGKGAVTYQLGSTAVQEAIYAHAETSWSPTTGHEPRPTVDLTRAYIFHLIPGSGHCELIEVDIVAGWEAAHCARWVRAWRKRKDLGRSVTAAADTLDFRREWLSQRVRALPDEAVAALALMSRTADLPRVSQSSAAHCDDWATLLDLIEAEFEVPFGARDPKAKR